MWAPRMAVPKTAHLEKRQLTRAAMLCMNKSDHGVVHHKCGWKSRACSKSIHLRHGRRLGFSCCGRPGVQPRHPVAGVGSLDYHGRGQHDAAKYGPCRTTRILKSAPWVSRSILLLQHNKHRCVWWRRGTNTTIPYSTNRSDSRQTVVNQVEP